MADNFIRREVTITVSGKTASLSEPIYLYPRDRYIDIFFTIKDAGFKFGSSQSYGDNAKGLTFFNALANLRKDAEEKEALDRRDQALLATSNVESVINGIIHTLQILKSHNKHLVIDFAKLGQDLYHFQFDSYSARETCLKWGEEYFAADANLKK